MNKNRIIIFLLGSIFLSLFFTGPRYEINIGIKIIPVDIVAFFLTFALAVFLFKKNKIPNIKTLSPTLIPLFLFILMVLVDVLRVDWPERNITLFIGLLRNFLILFFVSFLISIFKDYEIKLLKVFVKIVILVSIVSIGIYVFYLLQLIKIRTDPFLWKPGAWYNLREGGVLALSGPGMDPNFFGAVALVGFIFSLFLFNKKQYQIGAAIILLSLILTFSLTIFIILFALLIILWLISLFLSKNKSLKQARNNYSRIFISFILLFFIIGIFCPKFNVINIFQERFVSGIEKTGFNSRSDLWEKAIDEFRESPIFGGGGRAVLMKEAQYVHNDYLEILSSYGIIGTMIMFAFLLPSLIFPFKYFSSRLVLGSYIVILCYLIFMVGFSIFFNVYIYFILGLLWGGIILENRKKCRSIKKIYA